METKVRYGQQLYYPKEIDVDSESELLLLSDDDVTASEGLFPDGRVPPIVGRIVLR